MTNVVAVAIVTGCATLLGGLLGGIPSLLRHRIEKRKLHDERIIHIHQQTIELMRINLDRVKLLEIDKGTYATHE